MNDAHRSAVTGTQAASFVLAGGGTGGHVIPALAVARELRARGHAVRFIGTRRGMEAKLVPAQDFPIDWIEIGGLNRVGWRQSLNTLLELPWSIWQASRILERARPAAVFSTGGYVAGPVLLAALWKRIPVVIMEPNAVPGFTHRQMARFVARALVSFPETARWFPEGRTESHGVAGARRILSRYRVKPRGTPHGSDHRRQPGVANLESGGGRKLAFCGPGIRCGSFIRPARRPTRISRRTFVRPGVEARSPRTSWRCAQVYARADIVVSRAGMGAVSELAAAGKPSILVPLPTASDQHQLRNAEAMVQRRSRAAGIGRRDVRGAAGGRGHGHGRGTGVARTDGRRGARLFQAKFGDKRRAAGGGNSGVV